MSSLERERESKRARKFLCPKIWPSDNQAKFSPVSVFFKIKQLSFYRNLTITIFLPVRVPSISECNENVRSVPVDRSTSSQKHADIFLVHPYWFERRVRLLSCFGAFDANESSSTAERVFSWLWYNSRCLLTILSTWCLEPSVVFVVDFNLNISFFASCTVVLNHFLSSPVNYGINSVAVVAFFFCWSQQRLWPQVHTICMLAKKCMFCIIAVCCLYGFQSLCDMALKIEKRESCWLEIGHISLGSWSETFKWGKSGRESG